MLKFSCTITHTGWYQLNNYYYRRFLSGGQKHVTIYHNFADPVTDSDTEILVIQLFASIPILTMKLARNLFRRTCSDQPSVLDYETTEALATVLAGVPTKNNMAIPADDEKTASSSVLEFQTSKNHVPVVDWKLPLFDTKTTNEQTIEHELQRLIALRSYNILEVERDEVFDRITRLAGEVFEAPVAIINLVDLGRAWFVSGHGTGDLTCTSRRESFCAHVVQGKTSRPLIVPDLTKDVRFKDFSTVLGPPCLRFYAGAPLVSPEGYKLGALCIMDVTPRKHGLMDFEEEILMDLADMAMKIMVERRDKMLEHVNEINQDSTYYGSSCFGSLENLLGPPVTQMPKLLQSLNTLVKLLPKKVPITIELDSKVPLEIECNDVILLRAALSLLSHSARRTEVGSIHLKIQIKKKRVVFECKDTGPYVSTKPKHVQQYLDSLPKSSGMRALIALVRSMKGEYGIHSGFLSNKTSPTVFWFSPIKNGLKNIIKAKTCTLDRNVLHTIHAANQPTNTMDTIVASTMKTFAATTGPFEAAVDVCSIKPQVAIK